MMSDDSALEDDLIATLARDKGIAIARDDPIFSVILMNERILGAFLERAMSEAAQAQAIWLRQVAASKQELRALGPALEAAAGAGKRALKQSADDEISRAKVELGAVLAATANKIARQVAGRRLAWASAAAAVAVAVAASAFVAGFGVAFKAGLDAGARQALEQCRDDAVAASWATTPEGALARRFSALNPLEKMASCDGEGWRIKRQDGRRVCYPTPGYGWWMPSK